MDNLKEWLEHNLCKLNNVEKMDDPHAFTRLGFTNEEAKSHQQFIDIAKELNMQTYRDQAGNHWAIWKVDKNQLLQWDRTLIPCITVVVMMVL